MASRNTNCAVLIALLAALACGAALAGNAQAQRVPIRNSGHKFESYASNWREIKRRNIVMQRRDFSCGAATLATVARYYWGDPVDEDIFLDALDTLLTQEEAYDRIENGLAMSDLRRAAVKVGYNAVVGTLTFGQLTESKVPLVVGISPEGHDHFVVYRGSDGRWVYVADPIRGNLRMPIREFVEQWQQNAVLAIHKPGREVYENSPLSLRWDETNVGQLNDQLIRSLPQRQIARPPILLDP